jgi:hypothetical protein
MAGSMRGINGCAYRKLIRLAAAAGMAAAATSALASAISRQRRSLKAAIGGESWRFGVDGNRSFGSHGAETA